MSYSISRKIHSTVFGSRDWAVGLTTQMQDVVFILNNILTQKQGEDTAIEFTPDEFIIFLNLMAWYINDEDTDKFSTVQESSLVSGFDVRYCNDDEDYHSAVFCNKWGENIHVANKQFAELEENL